MGENIKHWLGKCMLITISWRTKLFEIRSTTFSVLDNLISFIEIVHYKIWTGKLERKNMKNFKVAEIREMKKPSKLPLKLRRESKRCSLGKVKWFEIATKF